MTVFTKHRKRRNPTANCIRGPLTKFVFEFYPSSSTDDRVIRTLPTVDILEFPLSTKGCRICGRLVFASSLMRTVFTLQSFCYFQAFGYSNVFSVQRSEISIAASAFEFYPSSSTDDRVIRTLPTVDEGFFPFLPSLWVHISRF